MQSAIMSWLLAVLLILIALFALIHPIVLAAKNRDISATRYNRWWFYLLWSLGTVALGPTIVFTRATLLGYQTFRVVSTSMSPTLEQGELFVSDSWRYHRHAVAVGEIVVFESPENPGIKYIKRVVAIAGDSVGIRDGVLYRNGRQVDEPYIHAPMLYGGSSLNVPEFTLGSGLIYVLGDYRDNSMDSRQWGPLLTSSLRGRVQYIWLSMDRENRIRWGRIRMRLNLK